MTCARKHPELPDVACGLPTETHPFHVAWQMVKTSTGGLVTQTTRWANDEYVSKAQQRQQSREARETVSQLAAEARAVQPAPEDSYTDGLKPLRAKSAQGRVAQFFLDHVSEWIPGRRFTDPGDINGGSEGLRRVRVLREEYGWPIEEQPDPDPNTFVSRYRLTHAPYQNAEII